MSFPDPILHASGLAMRFGRRVLFSDLDVVVRPGEAVAVTGPNGSGKSTLLTILAGLRTPTGGRVRMRAGDASVPDDERPLRVGFAAPYVHLYDDLSAHENLEFIARARRQANASVAIAAALSRVGLAGRENDLLKTYSSGMKQRARLAAALLPAPTLLLLDEPGSNLDQAGRELVGALVGGQCEAGGGVVLATNSEEEAVLCQRRVALG